MRHLTVLLVLTIGLFSCTSGEDSRTLFELKDNESIGIQFQNTLQYTKDFNVYKYRNYYNGGGVSLGDVNNDGLVDIYMVANQLPNKLYINKGDWTFEDVTDEAGVEGERAWSTGVTMADINADGWLDIYVCNSGDVKGDNKENELFINNGDGTFTESAADYNLNDEGYSTHASFFDYDKDGDLDAYILNNSFQAIGSFNLRKNERPVRDRLGGDKLMRNEGNTFMDVSEEAGIYGSVIGFGLGITVGDVNNDHWEDIFISNDFFERDYLYINQQDGTFKEDLVNQMPSTSGASMGADIGDLNNDGWNEIFVTEMLPSDYERLKSVTTFDDWDRYQYGVQNGYHHQFTRNILHYNNGNNTFSDIGRISGVEASDWSWGALFFDMDNDGLKDLFIANGIYQDLTDQDYLQYIANEQVMTSIIKDDGVNYKELIDIIPSNKVPNHAYKNLGNLQFRKYNESGLMTPGFSNGSAYGDLDNDGDLDLVVNNVNMPSFFYENKSNEIYQYNFIKFDLQGENKNKMAYGAKIIVKGDSTTWYAENLPIKGFQSSVDQRPTIGIGNEEELDIEIIWPSLKVSRVSGVKPNQTLTLSESEASENPVDTPSKNLLFTLIDSSIPFTHKENRYIDFNREPLLYHMLSTSGPCVSTGDINNDNIPDLVVPGPKGSPTSLIYGSTDQSYALSNPVDVLEQLSGAEHVRCNLFDADQDGDLDLYLASGGVEITEYSDLLFDELLLNDGKGGFESSGQRLPSPDSRISTSAIAHSDIDQDGDLDLFIGERVKIGKHGALCSGYILINDGQGNYEDATSEMCPSLKSIGMITDALFSDLDGDGAEELIVVGEFMGIKIFKNEGGKFNEIDLSQPLNGWWNVIEVVDIDKDGDMDIVAGNHGLNSRFRASEEHPIKMYYHDYDNNGFPEGIMTMNREDGKDYPFALRHKLVERLPGLKKLFPDFKTFKSASITDIFPPELLSQAVVSEANEMRSLILVNNGSLKFEKRILPYTVQLSPMFAICPYDVNEDGFEDLIMGGNLYNVKPEMGRYDASYGHVLINDGTGHFEDKANELGFLVKGEIRDIIAAEDVIHVFRNNEKVVSYQINRNIQ